MPADRHGASAHHGHDHHHAPAADPEGPARDPVCGMLVDPAAGKPSLAHGGVLYHFCSAGCRAKFAAQPERYLEPQAGRGSAGACRDAIHLPDAPGDDPRPARLMPDLRHGAGTHGPALGRREDPTRNWSISPGGFGSARALPLPLLVIAMGADARPAGARLDGRAARWSGSSWRWRRRWCCGRPCRSSGAAGTRWSTAAPTCGR